jgi:hypothetical protein
MSKIRIVLSEQRPVTLFTDTWTKIAAAEHHDGLVACQANTEWGIVVREHSDGRRIVYCYRQAGPGGRGVGFRETRGGWLLPTGRPQNDRESNTKTGIASIAPKVPGANGAKPTPRPVASAIATNFRARAGRSSSCVSMNAPLGTAEELRGDRMGGIRSLEFLRRRPEASSA